MSKKFKSQASSGRAGGGTGFANSVFGSTDSSPLSYIQEAPDYSSISDANVVVAFKNLSKKDGTTKAKALEDLLTYVTSSEVEVEESLLEAWVKLYPRMSIDSARRVRQLAHNVNGQVCVKCGKRAAKHLPRIAGPWLAGNYDNDRAVAKSASDALKAVFSSPEKIQGLERAFQGPILESCRDAALNESISSLSDERSVSPDDAEATHARVVATSLSVLSSLVSNLGDEEISKQRLTYADLFRDTRLWAFVTHPDSSIRKSTHKLVQTCVTKQKGLIEDNLKAASTAYLYKGLPSDQTGSAIHYVQTLNDLTTAFPAIWTEAYSGKKPLASRLRPFLKNGSHSGSKAFWDHLRDLFSKLPGEVLPKTYPEISDLILAARDGVQKRDERANASFAWPAYFTLVNVLAASLHQDECEQLLDHFVMPVIRQYLQPQPDTAEWSINGANASLVSRTLLVKRLAPVLEREWPLLGNKLVEIAKLSLPEQSKDFEKSQMSVVAAGERWAELQAKLFESNDQLPVSTIATFIATNTTILSQSIDLLESRDSKPFGAAAIIEQLLRTCATPLLKDKQFTVALKAYMQSPVAKWSSSPSRKYFVRTLYAIQSETFFIETFNSILDEVLAFAGSPADKLSILQDLFSPNIPKKATEVAKANAEMQSFIQSTVTNEQITLFSDLLRLDALSEKTVDVGLSKLTASLSLSDPSAEAGLSALELLSKADQGAIRSFVARHSGAKEQLLPSILRLEQSANDSIAEKASALSSTLSSALGQSGEDARYSVILQNLEGVSQTSLSMDAIQDLTLRLMGSDRRIQTPSELLPNLDTWLASLLAVMEPPRPSLAILSPLGGALHLCDPKTDARKVTPTDAEGFSQALRIGMYIARLMTETDFLETLGRDADLRPTVAALLFMTILVAEDKLSMIEVNGLWLSSRNKAVEPAILEFTSEANVAVGKYWQILKPDVVAKTESVSEYSHFVAAIERFRLGQNSGALYYHALASSKANLNLFELHGYNSSQIKTSEDVLRTLRTSKDIMAVSACIVGLQQPLSETPLLHRFYNELVAELTDFGGTEPEAQRTGFEQLVLLNLILYTQDDAVEGIAKQRLIFLVKHLIPLLSSDIVFIMAAEICKMLSALLPGMKDMYGDHWAEVISYLLRFWRSVEAPVDGESRNEDQLLLLHASLKLHDTLRKLSKGEDSNDDLVEALLENKDQISDSLVGLLKSENGVADDHHQPLMVTHELLIREVMQLPSGVVQDVDELYPMLYTPSTPIQQGAFFLLHKYIPAAQEQVSFDAALDNKTATLPDELLSLILEAPTLDSLADASFDRTMPLPLSGYLYSWQLVFDHFNGSSYRVKNDYIEQLKDGTYISGLLSFTFDFLGHSRGRPVDASKFDIQEYLPETEPIPEKDVQWLLIHLYYLALTHMPTSVKAYFLEIRSRQTSLAVESWTAKYISPLIISASLESVADWAEKSVKEDPEYEKMSVTVGMRSKEINVSYVVDEQTMAIKVVLPEAYPLASAQVQSVNRVAVKEEKWQSWLRNCRGVIVFSNGSITDGLSAWRKNVTGALKGQTECAICYSIISGDKQLPTKRCPTCKHLFHSSCLFKWFKTSNSSTCPLCRNAFNFN